MKIKKGSYVVRTTKLNSISTCEQQTKAANDAIECNLPTDDPDTKLK